MRHLKRRAVSIGPQSEADAYETLAYREKRRRESVSAGNVASPTSPARDGPKETSNHGFFHASHSAENTSPPASPTKTSKLDAYEHMMGTGSNLMTVLSDNDGSQTVMDENGEEAFGDTAMQERDEREMFSKLEKPRVRYDVEVVTKLVVYSG